MAKILDLPSWIYNAKLYQKVIIEGVYLPGKCTIHTVALETVIRENKEKGSSGEQPILEGFNRVDFEIKSLLTTATEEQQILSALNSWYYGRDPKQQNTLTIYHPMLAEMGISNCLIKKVTQSISAPGGYKEYTINCISVNKPKEGASKKAGTKTIKPIAKVANPDIVKIDVVQLPDVGAPSNNAKTALADDFIKKNK